MGAITFERHAANKGRTRANWNEVECKETRSMSGSVKSLSVVERMVDADNGLRGVGLSAADIRGLSDAAARMSLEERLLSYRAELMGWGRMRGVNAKTVSDVGFDEEHRRAMQASRKEIIEATKGVSDDEIKKRIAAAKKKIERHLRQPSLAGAMALRQGRPGLVSDPAQLHGLIPARDDKKRKREERA